MAPNMGGLTKMAKRRYNSVDRMFPFAKRDINEWGSR